MAQDSPIPSSRDCARLHLVQLFLSISGLRIMGLEGFQRRWCSRILDRLSGFKVTEHLKSDLLANIRQKLASNGYRSVDDWINDVNMVWFNVRSEFQPGSAVYVIADYLESWFNKKVARYPTSETDEWVLKFQKVQKRLKLLAESDVKIR